MSRARFSTARISAIAFAAVMSAAGARAAPTDCDAILKSTVPYEVTMQAGEAQLKYQVHRTDKGLTTLLIRQLDGNVTKLENQGTFPKSMTMPNGETASFEYSVPTDKPLYEQAVKQLRMKMTHDKDVLVDTPVTLDYLPDETIKLGACSYATKHYVQSSTQNGRESRNEIWYAPGLEFSLKSVSTVKVVGKEGMSKQSQATDLTTSFTPFK